MKRFSTLLLCALFTAVSAQSATAEWVDDEVKWQLTNQGGFGGTSIWVRDTLTTVLGGNATTSGRLDTSMTFTLKHAQPFYFGNATSVATGRDSLIAGFLVFYSDSSTVPTGAMSSIGLILEGRMGPKNWPAGSLAGWTPIDSLTALCADGDVAVSVVIPVRGGQKITTRPGISPFSFENLRVRPVFSVGALPSARVVLRHWVSR